MHRWMKTGICALAVGAMLQMPTLAAGLRLSFDAAGETAAVRLSEVDSGRYAAQVSFTLSGGSEPQVLQYAAPAENSVFFYRPDTGEVTLYTASCTPLNPDVGELDLGSLTVAAGTKVTGVGRAVLLDGNLRRTELDGLSLHVSGGPEENTSSGHTGATTPKVSVVGKGGQIRAERGKVTILPDAGYRIARIVVNGAEVAIQNVLTGLTATDKVVVYFEPETPESVIHFSDVAEDAWYAGAVRFVAERGLFQGLSDTSFGPEQPMSRAMLVTVLYRLSGESAPAQGGGFTDVPAGAWYADAVAWAQTSGIVLGVGEGRFAPEANVSREQTAAILSRYSTWKGARLPQGELTFADRAEISPYAAQAVAGMQAAGLMNGRDNNRFAPRAHITRAEVAALMMRYVRLLEG